MRDIMLGTTHDFKFTTRAFATGLPTTSASLAVAAYPDNSTTEITAGITTTFTSGFDARAGLVNVRVVATTGNGYASGVSYALVATAGTVAGDSIVGEVVGEFSIERSPAFALIGALNTAAATGDPGTTITLIAYLKQVVNNLVGSDGVATWAAGAAPANAVSISEGVRYIADNIGALNVAASTGDPGTTITVLAYLKQLINILIGADGIATFPAEAAPANAVSLAEVIRAIHADVTGLNGAAMRGTDNAALASVATEARLAELDAGNLPTDIANVQTTASAVETDTQDIQARILPATAFVSGTVNDAGPLVGDFDGSSGLNGTTDNFYQYSVLVFVSGTLAGISRQISGYTASTRNLTFTGTGENADAPWPVAPANGDAFVILGRIGT